MNKRSKIKIGKEKKKWSMFSVIAVTFLSIYALSLVLALLWALLSSLKSRFDFRENPFSLPKNWRFDNYMKAFGELFVGIETATGSRNVYMPELLFNTVVYALGSTIFSVMSPCLTAYIVAKYKFKGRNVLYATVIVTMLLPIVGSLPSSMILMKAIGFYDNLIGIWITKGSFLGMNFLIFYACFKSFSWDYAEAAFIDGASNFRVMVQINLPLAKTTILAMALLAFVGYWNEYETQLIYLPSMPSLAYGLFQFQFSVSTVASSVTIQLAGCMIVAIPIFILYMIFKDMLIGNIAVGGIKG